MKLNCLKSSCLLYVILVSSCVEQSPEKSKEPMNQSVPVQLDVSGLDLSWITGNWRDSVTWAHGNTQILESWYLDGNTLHGTGKQVKNVNDTNFVEQLSIDLDDRPVMFKAIVLDQNKNEPITFELKSYGNDSAYFENMSHDFPQMIIYKKINADTIHATVAGFVSGSGIRRQTIQLCRY